MKLIFLIHIFFTGCQTTTGKETQGASDLEADYIEIVAAKESPTLFDCTKCDIETVKKTEQSISTISDDLLMTFLCGFDKKCYTNIEYSEYSNEVLYKVITKQPQQLLKVIESMQAKGTDISIVYSEMSAPLLDYDYDSLIEAYRQAQGSQEIKNKIIDSLKKAKQG